MSPEYITLSCSREYKKRKNKNAKFIKKSKLFKAEEQNLTKMKKEALIIGVILIFLISIVSCVPATPQVNEVVIHEFYNNGCPHCQDLNKWIEEEVNVKYPSVTFVKYETSDRANSDKFREMAGAFGAEARVVPTLFIGEKVIVGFDKEGLEAEIKGCLLKKCIDAITKVPELK